MPDTPKKDPAQPADGLAPPLDALVERIAAQEPPEDVVRRSIQRVRQVGPMAAGGLSPRPYRRRFTAVAIAAAASLACVAAAWWFAANDGKQVEVVEEQSPLETGLVGMAPSEDAVPDGAQVDNQSVAVSPTFWAYHQAACRSPEALESLLEEHAREYAFGRSGATGLRIAMELNEETL